MPPNETPARLEEIIEFVEAVCPAVLVKRASRLRLEWALNQDDLRRSAKVPKRQLHQCLDIVGTGGSHSNG
jgi:hypothetical protein